ncbi:hypothetical protein EVAR_78692_1 [Eumeta japonica]|uniref:Uncharacterized protein n=1 Tax=Eumeta variegata TaxID=151549 RepID=A0A4C2A7X8_EUMVA|nr:hypothetical protein EVAR_78692_1 [Eumeta japonica]
MEHGILVKKQQISSCKVPQPVAQFGRVRMTVKFGRRKCDGRGIMGQSRLYDGVTDTITPRSKNNQRAGSVYTLKVSRFMAAERAIRLSRARCDRTKLKFHEAARAGGSSYELFRLGEIRSRYRKRRVQRPHKRSLLEMQLEALSIFISPPRAQGTLQNAFSFKRRCSNRHRLYAYGHSDGIAVYKKLTVPSYFEKVSTHNGTRRTKRSMTRIPRHEMF